MAQTISQTNGAWFKAFMVIFTAATLAFVGFAVGTMGDRYTGTEARRHIQRPHHENAGQQLAVLSNQIMELNRRIARLEAKVDVALDRDFKDQF